MLNPLVEGQLRQGKGKTYGFEVMIKKSFGKLAGQIGYSYTRSFVKIKGLNNNKEFPAHQDKPYDFSFSADYKNLYNDGR
ncbi:MAG: hypothetical protein HC906_11890 [Bacteroidales bacterium]|nr:hypothetical protein [Bacteroidales bacterium]